MNTINSLILSCVLMSLCNEVWGDWTDRKAEGWAWYEEEEKKPPEEKMEQDKPSPSSPVLSHTEQVAKIRKDLEESLSRAVLEPTNENVANYITEQKKWMDNASKFSTVWSYVVLNNPNLDATVTGFPVSQYGIQVQKQIVQERKEQLIKSLTTDHGLFFFYEGKEKTSQAFSLVVKEFERKYGWKVVGISLDGSLLPSITNSRPDNGIAKIFGITFTPSLYVVHPLQGKAIPIAFGLASLDNIENNVELQFTNLEEIK